MTLTRRSCVTTLLGSTLPVLSPLALAQTSAPSAAVVADEVWTDAARNRDLPAYWRATCGLKAEGAQQASALDATMRPCI